MPLHAHGVTDPRGDKEIVTAVVSEAVNVC